MAGQFSSKGDSLIISFVKSRKVSYPVETFSSSDLLTGLYGRSVLIQGDSLIICFVQSWKVSYHSVGTFSSSQVPGRSFSYKDIFHPFLLCLQWKSGRHFYISKCLCAMCVWSCVVFICIALIFPELDKVMLNSPYIIFRHTVYYSELYIPQSTYRGRYEIGVVHRVVYLAS